MTAICTGYKTEVLLVLTQHRTGRCLDLFKRHTGCMRVTDSWNILMIIYRQVSVETFMFWSESLEVDVTFIRWWIFTRLSAKKIWFLTTVWIHHHWTLMWIYHQLSSSETICKICSKEFSFHRSKSCNLDFSSINSFKCNLQNCLKLHLR